MNAFRESIGWAALAVTSALRCVCMYDCAGYVSTRRFRLTASMTLEINSALNRGTSVQTLQRSSGAGHGLWENTERSQTGIDNNQCTVALISFSFRT